MFLAGAWNDVIAAFMDIRNALEKFTQGTLTISGGVGIYDAKYPLNVMAKEVERLEDRSKHVEGKMQLPCLMKHMLIHGMYLYKMLLQKS